MKTLLSKLLIAVLSIVTCGLKVNAQHIERVGDTFVQIDTLKHKEPIKTKYIYEVKRTGESYPVYLSSTGKAFIYCVSKKTGKQYRRYLPELGKQINPEAYKEDEKK